MLFNCYKKDGSKEKISSIAAQKYVVVIADSRTKMLLGRSYAQEIL
jgi:hypothetical protein